MAATAADVHRNILEALRALVALQPNTSKPFAAVVDVTEPITANNVEDWVSAQWPCAMVFWQQSRDDADAETLGGGEFETRERSRWIVYVGVSDPRDETNTMLGATNVPGALVLKGFVERALHGLQIAAPPARATIRVQGVPGATNAIDPAIARVQFVVNGTTIEFSIEDTTVTYGPDGIALLTGTCVTPGALGNLQVNTRGNWGAGQPVQAFTSQVYLQAVITLGAFGTLRNKPLQFIEAQPGPTKRAAYYVLAMVFECETAAEQWTPIDESRPLGPINGDVNLISPDGAETPFVSFRANTQL